MSFSFAVGGSLPPAQAVQISAATATDFTITPDRGTEWLLFSPAKGTTPATVQVSVFPWLLGPTTYTGGYTVLAGAASVHVNVQLTVIGGNRLYAATPGLTFTYTPRTMPLASQSFLIASGGPPLSASVVASAPWVHVSPSNGTTPFTVNVSVDTALFSVGTYVASLTISGSGSQNQVLVPISLRVQPPSPVLLNVPWELILTFTDMTPAPDSAALPVNIGDLLTLRDGRQLQESTIGEILPNVGGSGGQGTWNYLLNTSPDGTTVGVKTLAMLSSMGQFIGSRIFHMQLKVSPDGRQIQGTVRCEIFDSTGAANFVANGTVAGRAVAVDSLDDYPQER